METINQKACDLKNGLPGENEIVGKSPDRMECVLVPGAVVLCSMFNRAFHNSVQGFISYFAVKFTFNRILHFS